MILGFPGTKGEIEESSKKHRYHSSMTVSYLDTKILVDYGVKHSPFLERSLGSFGSILITHAHPDHYIWTSRPADDIQNTVYLTEVTLDYSKNKPINYKIIDPSRQFRIGRLTIEAFDVMHSIRCPAVCFRIKSRDKSIVYAPDILDTVDSKEKVFDNIECLIADGSTLNRNLVRRRDGKLFGHAMVKTIINWAKKFDIARLIITHCGKQIVTMDYDTLQEKLKDYSEGKLDIDVAYDGWSTEL